MNQDFKNALWGTANALRVALLSPSSWLRVICWSLGCYASVGQFSL